MNVAVGEILDAPDVIHSDEAVEFSVDPDAFRDEGTDFKIVQNPCAFPILRREFVEV